LKDAATEAVVATMIVFQAEYEAGTCDQGRRPRRVLPPRIAGLAACVALLLSGCSSTTESTIASSATPTATSSAPEDSALKTIDPKAFQLAVDAAVDTLKVPGAMVVLRTPQGTFNAAVGTTELGAETPPGVDTHFRIASNTKTMTAALIVLLAQDGKLTFSDPVSIYVPNVPDGENITVA
jgi:D-alanyl-D-alanine carboxypeptidase